MPNHFAIDRHDIVSLFDEDSQKIEHLGEIEYCSNAKEFEQWAAGEGLAAEFDGEIYIKVINAWGVDDLMTLTEANEMLADS